ncbi:hypothetical protein RSAG8_10435, partial [Rhizoctonia solani AG-8 WAC10335]
MRHDQRHDKCCVSRLKPIICRDLAELVQSIQCRRGSLCSFIKLCGRHGCSTTVCA